jgi:hypothetical protein
MNKLHKHSQALGLVGPQYVVSQEGLIGDMSNWVRDLFKYKPEDHTKLVGKALTSGQAGIDSSKKLRKLLEKCFANDRWLSHQEFYEGPVQSNFATDVLHFGASELHNPIRAVLANAEEVIGNMRIVANAAAGHATYLYSRYDALLEDCRYQLDMVRDEYARRRAATQDTTTKKSASTDFFSTLLGDILPGFMIDPKVERLVKELEHGQQNARLGPENFWNSAAPRYNLFKHSVETGRFGDRQIKVMPGDKIGNTLPALTPQEIKELARLVLEWIDRGLLHSPSGVLQNMVSAKVGYDKMLWTINTDGWDPDDDWDTDPSDEQLLWYVIEYGREGRKLEDLLSQSKFNKAWVNNSALFGTMELAAVGIIHWIGASIKGRIPSQPV